MSSSPAPSSPRADANDVRPVAMVTGAVRRVGRAIAIELARCGVDLHLTSRRDARELDDTAEACRAASGGRVRIERHVADFSSAGALDALRKSLSSLDRLDALVHNASSYGPTPLDAVKVEDVEHHVLVNAAAPLVLTTAARPALERSILAGGGSVVCFSDIHVLGRPRRNYVAYQMSKGALTVMVEALARELAPRVRINAIAPGVVAWPDGTSVQERAAYEARTPLDRSGTPEDAAAMVRWLVLEAPFVTGEVIRLDGGRWLA